MSGFRRHTAWRALALALVAAAFLTLAVGWWRLDQRPAGNSTNTTVDADTEVSAAEAPASSADSARKPNVIWILLDALRAENLSCYGYERETSPNIDAIAKRGVLLEQAFSQANGTPLSVPSYLTGKYFPVSCLSSDSWRQLYRTPPSDEKLVPETMRQNGYASVAITGHPYFAPDSRVAAAFDECLVVGSGSGRAYAYFEKLNERAFSWLENRPAQPFFLYLHVMDTHYPYCVHDGHDAWIDKSYNPKAKASTRFSLRHRNYLRDLYDGSIHYADACIGELIAKLETLGVLENTIFVIGADHGDCLGEDGVSINHPAHLTADQLFHVPLIIAGPGFPEGKRVAALVENSDIVPTLVEALSLESEARMDGKSLLPLATGGTDKIHDYVVARLPRAEDDACEYITLRNTEYRFEYHPLTDSGELWLLPDVLGNRQNKAAERPDIVQAMKARVKADLLPLWERYAALPQSSPRPFPLYVAPLYARPPDAFVSQRDMKDNKWFLMHRKLASTATEEDCPPITFHFEVPNGRYRIQMELLPKDNGSAFAAKAEEDTTFKTILSTETSRPRVFVDLGVYAIKDGSFDITLDDADRQHCAVMSSFRLIPIVDGKEISPSEGQASRNEQLQALGYL